MNNYMNEHEELPGMILMALLISFILGLCVVANIMINKDIKATQNQEFIFECQAIKNGIIIKDMNNKLICKTDLKINMR